MKQEDYNSMQRYPWERDRQRKTELPICPQCGEKYCGDGICLCVVCLSNKERSGNENERV